MAGVCACDRRLRRAVRMGGSKSVKKYKNDEDGDDDGDDDEDDDDDNFLRGGQTKR